MLRGVFCLCFPNMSVNTHIATVRVKLVKGGEVSERVRVDRRDRANSCWKSGYF